MLNAFLSVVEKYDRGIELELVRPRRLESQREPRRDPYSEALEVTAEIIRVRGFPVRVVSKSHVRRLAETRSALAGIEIAYKLARRAEEDYLKRPNFSLRLRDALMLTFTRKGRAKTQHYLRLTCATNEKRTALERAGAKLLSDQEAVAFQMSILCKAAWSAEEVRNSVSNVHGPARDRPSPVAQSLARFPSPQAALYAVMEKFGNSCTIGQLIDAIDHCKSSIREHTEGVAAFRALTRADSQKLDQVLKRIRCSPNLIPLPDGGTVDWRALAGMSP